MGVADRLAAGLRGIGDWLSPRQAPTAPLDRPMLGGGLANRDPRTAAAIRSAEALFGRIGPHAGPSWTRNSSYPATDLTPTKIVNAQRLADQGYPLVWAEMEEQVRERDAHLGGITTQRAQNVAGKPLRVQREGDDDLATSVKSLCEEILAGIDGLDDSLESLLHANGVGWSASEIVYVQDRVSFAGPNNKPILVDLIVPRSLETIHPKHFQFDQVTDEPYLMLGSNPCSLPPGKIIFHEGEGSSPHTEKRGYMRSCVWLAAAKSWAFSDWIVWIHRYGIPTTVLSYDGDEAQYQEHKDVYRDILAALGDGRSAIMPQSAQIKPLEQPNGGRASDPHAAMVDACDASMSVRVTGATLTTRIGTSGSYAAASVHGDTQYGRELADARKLCATLRRDLLRPAIALNLFSLAKALGHEPSEIMRRVSSLLFRMNRETTPSEEMDILAKAIENGIEVDEEQVRDRFNLDAPRPGSRPIPGKPESVSKGGALVGSVEASREGAEAPPEETKNPDDNEE